MRKFKQDILNGKILPQILYLFFPILLGYLFQQLYNTVDAMIVGRYVGKEALAAVGGTTGTTIDLLVGFIINLVGGVTVVVAQNYGKRDFEKVNKSVRTGMSLSIIMGGVMMIVGIFCAPLLLKLLNVPDSVYELACLYIIVYFFGLIPSMIYNTGSSVLRAIGDSKRPLYYLVIACITNIVLDFVFVKYLSMGVFGAALATIISQLVSAIFIVHALYKTEDCYHYTFKEFGLEKDLVKEIICIGLPSGIQSIIYSVSNLYINASVNAFGTNAMAGYTAYGKVDGLYWIFNTSVGLSTLTVVGQNYGANKMDRVKKVIKTALLFDICATALISTSFCLLSTPLISLFTSDVEVIKIGVSIVFTIAPFWFLFAPIEIMSDTLRATGNTIAPMIISAIGICGTRFLYLTFYPYTSVTEALVCYSISWVMTTIVFGIYYFKGNWLNKKV